jgi:anthranilate phosphoribosyltransferase
MSSDESTPSFAAVFAAITSESGIQPELVRRVFDAILAGAWTPVQVAGFAVALRLSGETAPVIVAAAEALRRWFPSFTNTTPFWTRAERAATVRVR